MPRVKGGFKDFSFKFYKSQTFSSFLFHFVEYKIRAPNRIIKYSQIKLKLPQQMDLFLYCPSDGSFNNFIHVPGTF